MSKLVVLKKSVISRKILYLLILAMVNFMVMSCTALKKNKCSCPAKQGFVGY